MLHHQSLIPSSGSSSLAPYYEGISDTLGLLPLPSKRQLESMGKNTWVVRVYWVIILHSYMGIWINRYKDPYETASISWKVRDPRAFFAAQIESTFDNQFFASNSSPIFPALFSVAPSGAGGLSPWHDLGICRQGSHKFMYRHTLVKVESFLDFFGSSSRKKNAQVIPLEVLASISKNGGSFRFAPYEKILGLLYTPIAPFMLVPASCFPAYTWICLRCFDGDLEWYNVKDHLKQTQVLPSQNLFLTPWTLMAGRQTFPRRNGWFSQSGPLPVRNGVMGPLLMAWKMGNWSYNPDKWPYKWANEGITPINGLITG